MTDANWRQLAESSRQALALLGYTIGPACLPGESDPCGATCAEHVAAQLAALKAVADHHLAHLGVELVAPIYGPTYESITDDLARDCSNGHPGPVREGR
jgi:hypothetical protein